MSETIAPAQDVSKYMYQIRKLKDALATASQERDAARTERDSFKSEAAELKVKGDSSALAKRNQELEGKLREITHRKVLDKAALAKGVKAEALDAFYKLSEYEAKGDPDDDEVGAFVDSKIEALGFLVGKPAKPGADPPLVKPGPASGKSKPGSTTANGFDLPPKGDARWNDPKWYMKNQDNLAALAADAEAKGIVLDF